MKCATTAAPVDARFWLLHGCATSVFLFPLLSPYRFLYSLSLISSSFSCFFVYSSLFSSLPLFFPSSLFSSLFSFLFLSFLSSLFLFLTSPFSVPLFSLPLFLFLASFLTSSLCSLPPFSSLLFHRGSAPHPLEHRCSAFHRLGRVITGSPTATAGPLHQGTPKMQCILFGHFFWGAS